MFVWLARRKRTWAAGYTSALSLVEIERRNPPPPARRIMARHPLPPINPEIFWPKSLTAEVWEDYRIFKAAGLLNEWFDLYRDVLNLEPQHTQAAP